MSNMRCLKAYATGCVQGVGYRAFIAELANSNGVHGHAINLPDGRVEMLLCGSPEAVDMLLDQAHIGPALAEVRGLEVHESSACLNMPSGFTTC